jgi:hypothetical protein
MGVVVTEKQFGQGLVTDGFTTFYTVPADCISTVLTMDICNHDTSGHTIQLCFVPDGDSPEEGNDIFWDLTIAAKSALTWTGPQTLKDVGSTIQALTDVTEMLTLTISGVEKVTTA